MLQSYVEQKLKDSFEKKYQCKLGCKLDAIDWFALQMHFSQITISDTQESEESCVADWSVMADKLKLSCSWWSLIMSLKFKVSGLLEHMIMQESYTSQPASLPQFLKKLFVRDPDGPIQYDSLVISDGLLLLAEKDTGLSVHLPYVCNMSCQSDNVRVQYYLKDGCVLYNQVLIADGVSGSIVCDVPDKDVIKNMYLQMNGEVNIVPFAQKGHCFFSGSMRHGLGSFSLKNDDESFVIDPIQLRADTTKCLFDAAVTTTTDLCKQLDLHDICQDVQGVVQIDCRGDLYDFLKSLLVDISIDNVAYKTKNILKECKVFVQYQRSGSLQGCVEIQGEKWFELTVCSENNTIVCDFCNSREFVVTPDSYWKVPAQQCKVKIIKNNDGQLHGSYHIEVVSDKLDDKKKLEGSLSVVHDDVVIQGAIEDVCYDIILNLSKNLFLQQAQFSRSDKKLIDFQADKNDSSRLLGMVDFLCLKSFVSDQLKSSFAQEGKVDFEGYVKDGVYYSQLCTKDANIRIPYIYNVIQSITAGCEVDIYNHTVQFKNVKAELHEGEVACSQATLVFDKGNICSFVHLPLLLHNVLLSWDKGIFMLLSGGLLLQKSHDQDLELTGQMIVEKSQLKENLFSSEFQEMLFGKSVSHQGQETLGSSCKLDVSIFTKELLQVKTSFLSAKARVDMSLQGTIGKPELLGLVHLLSGSFYFPYKPLEIVDGKMFFVPEQQFDPLIEVFAKGKLKRYGVSMRVAGSIFDPYVQFESVPYLTEEQIMSLLLLGIEDSSLSVMVPALLTRKFKDIIFGPALSRSTLKTKFDWLFNSLNNFRFLPQFTSQTGRGGMRGVFEVDVSDNLHGRIDTNLMHLEDTKFDVDFTVTDDITFRVQKDGPSTYGGEVEFRMKFN